MSQVMGSSVVFCFQAASPAATPSPTSEGSVGGGGGSEAIRLSRAELVLLGLHMPSPK